MSTAAPFESQKRIRFHHCDPAGIVFYPQYFVLMNELVEDWFNDGLGVDFARFHAEGRHGIPMAHIECDFLAPSKVGETLAFRLAVQQDRRLARSRSPSRPAPASEARVRATLVVVQASLDTRRAVPFSPEFRAKLARYAV